METKLTFSEYLEDCLQKNDVKKSDLAKRLKVGKSTITKWCSGNATPRLYQLETLAKELDMDLNYFFGIEVRQIPIGYEKRILELLDHFEEDTLQKLYETIALIQPDKK